MDTHEDARPEEPTSASSANALGKLLSAADRRLGDWGLRLLRHPSLGFIFLVAFPLIQILAAAAGGPSWILYRFQDKLNGKEFAAQVAATEFTFDVSMGAILPLMTMLTTAALMVYGHLRHTEGLQESLQKAQELSKVTLDQAVAQIGSELGEELRESSTASLKEISAHVDAIVPAWTVASSDPVIRQYLRKLTSAIRESLGRTNDEHRVIIRSLFRGMTHRFAALTVELPEKGAFMDPQERRQLTEELFSSTKSYHVIFCGYRPLKSGDWRWHQGYLDFLEEAKRLHGDHISWTFIDWDDNDRGRAAALRDVHSLGIRCYVFKGVGTTGDLGRETFEAFFQRGPLIEVFGRDFPVTQRMQIKEGAYLTWKATSLQVRTSTRAYVPWTPDAPVKPARGEGVWGADNIDKLVRAAVIHDSQSPEFQVLDVICRHRMLESA